VEKPARGVTIRFRHQPEREGEGIQEKVGYTSVGGNLTKEWFHQICRSYLAAPAHNPKKKENGGNTLEVKVDR